MKPASVRTTTLMPLRILLVVVILALGIAVVLRRSNEPNSAGTDPGAALAFLGELGEPVEVQEATFDASGGAIRLDDGTELIVPQGALAGPTRLTVERIWPGFEAVNITVDESAIYRVTLGDEKRRTVEPPIVLEIPWAPDRTVVASLENGEWVSPRVASGESVRVELDHFSTRTIVAVAASLASGLRTTAEQIALRAPRWDLRPGVRDLEAAHRERIRGRSLATQQFYGVGETTAKSPADMCQEFHAALLADRERLVFEAPAGSPGWLALVQHLGDKGKPSAGATVAKWYSNATSASHDVIRERVIAAGLGHPITAATVLRIAIDANGGNVPLGVLAAHNLLKNIAYEGRNLADPTEDYKGAIADVSDRDGQFAASIETWRRTSDHSPSGRYDKMGPIYHIFAAMVARVWEGPKTGQLAATFEVFLRSIGWDSDIPDPDKGAADECGIEIGAWIEGLQDEISLAFEPVTDKAEVAKPLPLTLTVKNLTEEGISIGLSVVSGQGSLSRTGLNASPGRSSDSCAVTGRTAVCGVTLTLTQPGAATVEARSGATTAIITVGGDICVEGSPVDQPLTGGLQRLLQSSASFCFPAGGGEVKGTIVQDFYGESSERFGTGPVRITCSYNLRLEYTFHGTFTPPTTLAGSTVDLAIIRDVASMQGPDCAFDRRVPSTSGSIAASWDGTFDGQRRTGSAAGQLMFDGRV